MVVEKTQVFHYCEPGGGEGKRERGREREAVWLCGFTSLQQEPKQPRLTQTASGKEGKWHGSGVWQGELTVGSRLDFP